MTVPLPRSASPVSLDDAFGTHGPAQRRAPLMRSAMRSTTMSSIGLE